MSSIIRFRASRRRFDRRQNRLGLLPFPALLMVAFISGFVLWQNPGFLGISSQTEATNTLSRRAFDECGYGARVNCVVDGDTFYMDGTKIRVADIDTPETSGARCAYEANLGARATRRFTQLLNAGPFLLRSIGGRDEDQYGRKLRTVHRDGISLGAILVSEGLARNWDGRRHPWRS